jgi:hypothetical protein
MPVTGSKFKNNFFRTRDSRKKAWAKNDQIWKLRRSRAIQKSQHIGTQLVNSVLRINQASNELQALHLMKVRLYNPDGGYNTPSAIATRINMQV